MPIAKLLRTILGLDSSDSTESMESTSVTVEREPDDETDAEEATEAATDLEAETETEPDGKETDIETESEPETKVDEEAATEAETEAEAEKATDEEESPAEADAVADGEPVENVSGIGPAYAQRLADAGVETVGQLLAADPAGLAERTDVSEKRIGRWQDRAEEL